MSLCRIIRVYNPLPVEIGKIECSVHLYSSPLSGHENYDQESFLSTGWLLMKHLFSTYESGNNKNAEDSDIDEHETTKDPLDEG